MAETEKKILLRVETGDSKKTVKSLKQDISDLKDAILNLDEGTDDYVKAVNELQKAQRELNKVQALTKESAVALDGSYDALTHQMALLRKEWKATNDEARRNELGKQIDEINDQLKELDGSIGNFQRNVGNYQSALDGVNVQQKDFGERMSDMQKQIEPTKMKFESVSNIASGLASGFAAVQGAMALCGVEGENFEKTMIKIQSAMALAQGVGGLSGLVEGLGKAKVAFKGIGGVLGGTLGIIALFAAFAAGCIAVVGNLDKIERKLKKLSAADQAAVDMAELNAELTKMSSQASAEKIVRLKELAKGYANLGDNLTDKKKYVAEFSEELANMGIKMTDVNDADNIFIEQTDDYINALIARAKADAVKEKATEDYKKSLEETAELEAELARQKANQNNGTPERTFWENLGQAIIMGSNSEPAAPIAANTQLVEDWDEEIAQKNVDAAQKALDAAKAKAEADLLKAFEIAAGYEAEADKLLQSNGNGNGGGGQKTPEQIRDELVAKIQEQMYNDIINMEFDDDFTIDDTTTKPTGYQYQNGDAEKRYGFWNGIIDSETSQKVRRMALDGASQEEQDAELIKGEERKLQKLKEFWKQARSEGDVTGEMALRQQIADQELLIEEEKNRAIVESAERAKEKRLKIMEEVSQGIQAAGAVVQGLTDIYQESAEKDDVITKEEAKKLKALQIASATINMLQGAVTAFSSAQSLGPIAGPIVGAVNAAAVVAMGVANIQKIRHTDLTGGVSSGGGASVTPSYGSYSSELPVNYTRNVTTSSEVDELNKDTKVYILESDLTEASNRVQVRQNESSF